MLNLVAYIAISIMFAVNSAYNYVSDYLTTAFYISQGDAVFIGFNGCTVGYVSDGFALTAAHCGDVGDKVFNQQGRHVGYVTEKPADDVNYDVYVAHDWAVIELKWGVFSGENSYSGDDIISAENVEIGDEVCRYGAFSDKVSCSHIVSNEIFGDPAEGAILANDYSSTSGDSGGAVWIPNEGLVGVHQGVFFFNNEKSSVTAPIMNKVPEKYLLIE